MVKTSSLSVVHPDSSLLKVGTLWAISSIETPSISGVIALGSYCIPNTLLIESSKILSVCRSDNFQYFAFPYGGFKESKKLIWYS